MGYAIIPTTSPFTRFQLPCNARSSVSASCFALALAFLFALPSVNAQEGAVPIEDVVAGINARLEKAQFTAVGLDVSRQSSVFTQQLNAALAVNDDMYLMTTALSDSRREDEDPYVYDRAADGQDAYHLTKNVKKTEPSDAASSARQARAASLAAFPGLLAESNMQKESGALSLFDRQEVKTCRRDPNGNIVVEIDGTKRSDFERIVYTFSPENDWALMRAEYWSGANLVAAGEAGNGFVEAPGSGLALPGAWTYTRLIGAEDNPNLLTHAEVRIAALTDFDLENPESFRLKFPPDALTEEEVRAKNRLAAAASQGLTQKLPGDVIENLSASAAPGSPTQAPQSPSPTPASGGSAGATRDDRPEQGGAKTPVVVAMAFILAALLTVIAVFAGFRASRLRIHRTALFVGALSLGLLVLCVLFQSQIAARSFSLVTDDARLQTAVAAVREDQMPDIVWPHRLEHTEYLSKISYADGFLTYHGWLTRTGPNEEYSWRQGSVPYRMIFTANSMERLAGENSTSLEQRWSPAVYPLLQLYARHTGQTVDVLSAGDIELDLSGMDIPGPLGPETRPEVRLRITRLNVSTVEVRALYDGACYLTLTLYAVPAHGVFVEHHAFFDGSDHTVFEQWMEYKLDECRRN